MDSITTGAMRRSIQANLVCMASMIAWAAGLPAAEPLIDILPPIHLTAGRMVLAALALIVIWIAIEGTDALRRVFWLRGMAIGGLALGLGAALLIYGQALSDPVTVAIVGATIPVVGIALEVLLDGRRMTLALVLGLLLSLAGGLVALDFQRAGAGFGLGALCCLASVVTFTIGSRLTVTALPGHSPLAGTAVTVTGAGLATLIVALLQETLGFTDAPWGALSAANWAQLGFFAIFSMSISQVLWITSVGRLGIGLAGLHINATPFYVMLMLFALGAPWNWHQAFGALVVGLGVMVAQNPTWLKRRPYADA